MKLFLLATSIFFSTTFDRLFASPIKIDTTPEIKKIIDFKTLSNKANSVFSDSPIGSIVVKDHFFLNISKKAQPDLILGLEGFSPDDSKNPKLGSMPIFGGVAYYQNINNMYVLRDFETLGEYYANSELDDLIGDSQKELVVFTGSGNHAGFLDVYSINNGSLKNVCHIDGYGAGPGIVNDNSKLLIVDFKNSFINACEACQVSHEQVYHWDGSKFKEDPDPLGDCIDLYYKSMEDTVHKEDLLEQALSCSEDFVKKHPNSFAAIANCAELANEIKSFDKANAYNEKLKALDPNIVTDCPHCGPLLKSQISNNQSRYLGND